MPCWTPHDRQRIVHTEWCGTVFYSLFNDISIPLHVNPFVYACRRCAFRLRAYSVHDMGEIVPCRSLQVPQAVVEKILDSFRGVMISSCGDSLVLHRTMRRCSSEMEELYALPI